MSFIVKGRIQVVFFQIQVHTLEQAESRLVFAFFPLFNGVGNFSNGNKSTTSNRELCSSLARPLTGELRTLCISVTRNHNSRSSVTVTIYYHHHHRTKPTKPSSCLAIAAPLRHVVDVKKKHRHVIRVCVVSCCCRLMWNSGTN